jgi:hypothetical protein
VPHARCGHDRVRGCGVSPALQPDRPTVAASGRWRRGLPAPTDAPTLAQRLGRPSPVGAIGRGRGARSGSLCRAPRGLRVRETASGSLRGLCQGAVGCIRACGRR